MVLALRRCGLGVPVPVRLCVLGGFLGGFLGGAPNVDATVHWHPSAVAHYRSRRKT